MALFIISIPLMVLAAAIAVLPLMVMSFAEHRRSAETTTGAADLRARTANSGEPDPQPAQGASSHWVEGSQQSGRTFRD